MKTKEEIEQMIQKLETENIKDCDKCKNNAQIIALEWVLEK